MLIFTKAQIQHLDVIANTVKEISNGAEQPGHICGSRSRRIRQPYVPALPRLSIG